MKYKDINGEELKIGDVVEHSWNATHHEIIDMHVITEFIPGDEYPIKVFSVWCNKANGLSEFAKLVKRSMMYKLIIF